ncbi:hypothetical protein CDAR_183901 [Caerostris darwini]|uniref:Ycf15 n=1 Tax=Caerostris darwini TaxID=1538125 RepID=A0AAV4TWV1_9ARAC|nr:hypothetical protein CDAR_183901 [Caerostris darwini]
MHLNVYWKDKSPRDFLGMGLSSGIPSHANKGLLSFRIKSPSPSRSSAANSPPDASLSSSLRIASRGFQERYEPLNYFDYS